MLSTLIFTLLALLSLTAADFIVSNTAVCQGLPTHCPAGAQVVSAAETEYSCDKLIPAQHNAYLRNGTMGPYGDWNIYAVNICRRPVLNFGRRWDGDGYDIVDDNGNDLGHCRLEQDFGRVACDRWWVVQVMFESLYWCSSPVCKEPRAEDQFSQGLTGREDSKY